MYRNAAMNGGLVIITLGAGIVAMDRATGTRVWHHKANGFVIYGRLTVTPDLVIASGGKTITALVYATGAHIYTLESPIHTGTWLYDSGQIFASGQGEVACFDAETGKLLWHDRFPGLGHFSSALGVPGNVAQVDHS